MPAIQCQFIIEISLCGSVTACLPDGEELTGEILDDVRNCNRSGDCEPACQHVLDTYSPEFRIVRRTNGVYANVPASFEEKKQCIRESGASPVGDEDTANLYLVWFASADIEQQS